MPSGAISGPAVARSATGQSLALGPPGPPGKQGPQGLPGAAGPAGAALAAILRLAAAGTIVCAGAEQPVNLDYTAAGFVQPMPVGCADGQVVAFQDLSATGTFTWPSTGAGVSVSGGTKIQNPQTGELVTGTLLWSSIGALPGNGWRWRYNLPENVWTLA